MNDKAMLWYTVIITIAIIGMILMLLIYYFEQKQLIKKKLPNMNKEQQKTFNELPAYQQRMVNEYLELNDRVMKLGTFLNSKNEKYTNLPIEEQGDMMMQYHAMVIYKMALYNRLERAGIAKIFIPQQDCCE